MTDLESFKTEIRKSGVSPDGVTLCNCEVRFTTSVLSETDCAFCFRGFNKVLYQMTGGNDISLIYPWVNINSLSQDIWGWVDREESSKDRGDIGSPDTTAAAAAARRKLSQGNKDLFCSSRGASVIYCTGTSATFCPIFCVFVRCLVLSLPEL